MPGTAGTDETWTAPSAAPASSTRPGKLMMIGWATPTVDPLAGWILGGPNGAVPDADGRPVGGLDLGGPERGRPAERGGVLPGGRGRRGFRHGREPWWRRRRVGRGGGASGSGGGGGAKGSGGAGGPGGAATAPGSAGRPSR
ncbi:hypothetical protein [Mycobacterium intracellulare]|uniref:hypothetical protein n=1 Tax=Mycobacterium intracellulare TaxID=1767 RepID=UPI003AB02E17